jgi:hypothetical protein
MKHQKVLLTEGLQIQSQMQGTIFQSLTISQSITRFRRARRRLPRIRSHPRLDPLLPRPMQRLAVLAQQGMVRRVAMAVSTTVRVVIVGRLLTLTL